MRDILFRGKRLDNGELVYGAYYHQERFYGDPCDRHFIIVSNEDLGYDQALEYFEVDPATVGQYTGLKDKNGKRIFEWDIVRYYERQLGGEDVPINQCVGYEEGGFCVHRYFLNNWLRNAVNGNIQLEGIEVIGNIHDNPELLDGGTE